MDHEKEKVIRDALHKLEGVAEGLAPFHPGLHRYMYQQFDAIYRCMGQEKKPTEELWAIAAAETELKTPTLPPQLTAEEIEKADADVRKNEALYDEPRIFLQPPPNGFTMKSMEKKKRKKLQEKVEKKKQKVKEDNWLQMLAEEVK